MQPSSYRLWFLHSDVLDNADEDFVEPVEAAGGELLIALATQIAAKGCTLPTMKYGFVHPKVREEVLHASGLYRLTEQPLQPEQAANMVGRIALPVVGFLINHNRVQPFPDQPLVFRRLEGLYLDGQIGKVLA